MPERKRYVTVEEANQFIPKLEKDILELKSLRKKLEAIGVEMSSVFENIHLNGGHRKTPEYLQLISQFHSAVARIHSYGCVLKNIDPGLVDFPHLRNGREVYLCWQFGEDEIRYWHDVDAGFAGRQPL